MHFDNIAHIKCILWNTLYDELIKFNTMYMHLLINEIINLTDYIIYGKLVMNNINSVNEVNDNLVTIVNIFNINKNNLSEEEFIILHMYNKTKYIGELLFEEFNKM